MTDIEIPEVLNQRHIFFCKTDEDELIYFMSPTTDNRTEVDQHLIDNLHIWTKIFNESITSHKLIEEKTDIESHGSLIIFQAIKNIITGRKNDKKFILSQKDFPDCVFDLNKPQNGYFIEGTILENINKIGEWEICILPRWIAGKFVETPKN